MSRLWVRLTLAFVAVTLVGVGLVAALAGVNTDRDFRNYLQAQQGQQQQTLADQLGAFYATNQDWNQLGRGFGYNGMMHGPGHMGRGPSIVVADANGKIVFDDAGMMRGGGTLTAAQKNQASPIQANGQTVGYVVLDQGGPPGGALQAPEQNFLAQLRGTLLIAGLVAGGLGAALGIGLSRTLTAPLANLAHAAHRFAARDWSQRVPVRGAQELAEVATAFNRMADDLQAQETLRRNMISDIAHELNTPLTVMQGNLRAMLDEVYPLDRSEIATLYDETRLLGRMVGDLRELALADAGQLPLNLQPMNVGELVQNAAANFATAADAQSVRVATQIPANLAQANADPDRVAQVLRNLLANALRHTPSGGSITVGAQPQADGVRLYVQDTGEGISPEDLPHVFERLYRADKSRTRATGGTGLGLAIAKAWVEAMGGAIGAASERGAGSTFWFTLPVYRGV